MSTPPDNQTRPDDRDILRKARDVVQIVYPTEDGEAHVLQFADGECDVVFSEGGQLVWAVLDLCDGNRTVAEVLDDLRRKFDSPDTLWEEDIPQLLNALTDWRALELVPIANGGGCGAR